MEKTRLCLLGEETTLKEASAPWDLASPDPGPEKKTRASVSLDSALPSSELRRFSRTQETQTWHAQSWGDSWLSPSGVPLITGVRGRGANLGSRRLGEAPALPPVYGMTGQLSPHSCPASPKTDTVGVYFVSPFLELFLLGSHAKAQRNGDLACV